jgi:hypothetical protein
MFLCKEFIAFRWQTAPSTVAIAHLILGGAAVHRSDNWLDEITLGESPTRFRPKQFTVAAAITDIVP